MSQQQSTEDRMTLRRRIERFLGRTVPGDESLYVTIGEVMDKIEQEQQ